MFINRSFPLVFLFLIVILQACAPSAQSVEGENWVAFSAEQARKSDIGQWLFSEDTEYWSPAENHILALEGGVSAYLQENPASFFSMEQPVWERLGEYNRQYIGVVQDGRKIVYANYFCNSMETDWKRDFVLVMDGGACYFQFKYDVESAEFFELQVNGES